MYAINYSSFDLNNLNFEFKKITVKDKDTGKDIDISQLLFNYVDPASPIRVSSSGEKKCRCVIQGPKLKTRRPLSSREGKSGTEYSLYQSFDLENQQEADWVRLNRDISAKVAETLGKKDVKDFIKHDKVKSILPAVTPCFIYQKKSENEEGEEVFEEGSRPSCYFNFFEVNTDKWNFGTKVRIHGSTKDLPKEKWLRLLQNNIVEYTPFLSYLRISYVGGVFRLKVQLDSIIIHNYEKYERTSQMDNVQKKLGVSDEDRRRAAELEALLEMSVGEQRSVTTKTNGVEDEDEQRHMNSTVEDW
jgi:hypothetical protein